MLIPNSGFVDFGLSVGLKGDDEQGQSQRLTPEELAELSPEDRAFLAELPGEPDTNAAVAAEWENFGAYGDCFEPVYDLITPLFDTFYESHEPREISNFFERCSTNVLLQFKAGGALKAAPFEDDVLLGVQFADPNHAERVIRVSKQVNSDAWHAQVVAYFDYHAKEQARTRRRPAKKATKKAVKKPPRK